MEKGDSERRAEPCKALQPTLKIGDLVLGKNGTPFKDLKQGVDMTGFAVLCRAELSNSDHEQREAHFTSPPSNTHAE